MLLGRASDDIALSDYTISRRHAELRPSARGWAIEDMRSSNGTYLNGNRLDRPMRLKHGDLIRLGSTVLIWDGSEDRVLDGSADTVAVGAGAGEPEPGAKRFDASILGSVPANDESMVLATPVAAEAVRSWRVVSSLLQTVAAVDSPRQLIEKVMDIVFQEVPADHGFILMRDENTGKFETDVVRGLQDTRDKVHASRTIVDHVLANREGVLCSNAMSDARFRGGHSDSILAMGLQSVICVPMIAREQALGVIYIDCPMGRHVYTEEQLRLVAAIGQMAALVIEDARLVKERMRTERLAATGETVAALSHYVKNILQGMKGGSDIVALGLRNRNLATVEQGWQIVERNLDKIFSLTTNMLAFAKHREPRLEPIQLKSLVEDVLKLVQKRAEDKGASIESELSDAMPAIMVDETGIHQVLMNIIVNAIDAVPKATGAVNVKAAYDAVRDTAVLTVSDNGPGIPKQIRERVFDAFYSTKGHGGTGLGLAVAKKIIDEHVGKIEIDSAADRGTVVRIILPANSQQALDSNGTHGPALLPQ